MKDDYNDFDDFDDAYEDEDLLINKYLAIELAGVKYAIKLENVKEIIMMPQVIAKPSRKDYEKGLIKLRNSTLTLFDLRKRFGLPSFDEEDKVLVDMLKQREQDHINWVNELTSCVRERREFKLTFNPHECAFGRWYDNFKTESINISLFFSQFDVPHKRIHASGAKAMKLMHDGYMNAAEDLVQKTRETDLMFMLDLFHDAPRQIKDSRREIAVIIEYSGAQKAVSIDNADKIVEIPQDKIRQPDESEQAIFIDGIASVDGEVYIMLDEAKLLDYI